MILEVTNGLKNIVFQSPAIQKDEALQILKLPKKTIEATAKSGPLQLTDTRLAADAQLTFTLKGKKTYFSTNITPCEILRSYPESITVKKKEAYELRKGDIIEVFHQAYIFRVVSL